MACMTTVRRKDTLTVRAVWKGNKARKATGMHARNTLANETKLESKNEGSQVRLIAVGLSAWPTTRI
jgi:hypothetical protein